MVKNCILRTWFYSKNLYELYCTDNLNGRIYYELMASESTVSAVNRFTNTFVLAGIVALGAIGMVNLFAERVGLGLGFVVTSLILLRVFVWIEKSKAQIQRR